MKFLIASLFVSACVVFAADVPSQFTSAGLVPDIIPKAPSELLSVTYKDAKDKEKDLVFGDELTPTLVKDPPALAWYSEDNAYYTVAMVDPDAPSREDPKTREMMLHWLVTNVQGGDMSKGDTIAEYIGSGPCKESGIHRYIVLVYKQPDKLITDEARISNRERAGRPKFSINNFADKYKLGAPVAGNMFRAQYDDYVLVLRKQMSEGS